MARTAITATSVPSTSSNGYNLTDSADFSVLATGSNNGVEFDYAVEDVVILKNTTGGAAVYTLVAKAITGLTNAGGSVTDPTVTVAAGKTHVIKPAAIFNQANGKFYIDCDVAGSALVLNF